MLALYSQIITASNLINTCIYNLISVPQITRYLLVEAITSSITNRAVAARRRREVMPKLEIMKQCQGSLHLFQLSI